MDVLGLGELAVGDGRHHAERREHWRPYGAATPLDDLHHVPEGASGHVEAMRLNMDKSEKPPLHQHQKTFFVIFEKFFQVYVSP